MNAENQASAYEIVLRDLRGKRAQIDQAIAAIEALMGGTKAAPASAAETPAAQDEGPGDYLGMSIPEAAKKLLAKRRKTMGNGEIARALKEGGLVLTSADPVNTIGSVLTRRFHQVGDIVRVDRGMWGLKEWYPNRTFNRKPGENGDAPKASDTRTSGDPNAPGRPSEPSQSDPPDPWP